MHFLVGSLLQLKGLSKFSPPPSHVSIGQYPVGFVDGALDVEDDRLQTFKLPFCVSSIVQ